MGKLLGNKLTYKGSGKGDKTASRTNWKSWFAGKALPERVVKLWPRDKKGRLK
jgi:hypothetical protein